MRRKKAWGYLPFAQERARTAAQPGVRALANAFQTFVVDALAECRVDDVYSASFELPEALMQNVEDRFVDWYAQATLPSSVAKLNFSRQRRECDYFTM